MDTILISNLYFHPRAIGQILRITKQDLSYHLGRLKDPEMECFMSARKAENWFYGPREVARIATKVRTRGATQFLAKYGYLVLALKPNCNPEAI